MATPKIQSSSYNPVYPVSESGNLLVEVMNGMSETPTSIIRTPTLIITSTQGIIPAGAKSIAIANSGSSPGILLGSSFPVGISVLWEAPYGDTIAAISYNATGTTFVIKQLI